MNFLCNMILSTFLQYFLRDNTTSEPSLGCSIGRVHLMLLGKDFLLNTYYLYRSFEKEWDKLNFVRDIIIHTNYHSNSSSVNTLKSLLLLLERSRTASPNIDSNFIAPEYVRYISLSKQWAAVKSQLSPMMDAVQWLTLTMNPSDNGTTIKKSNDSN